MDRISREYVQDDEWRVADANMMPMATEASQRSWEQRHRPDGSHLPPVAQAAARVTQSGASYVINASEGIAGITRLGTGHIRIELEFAMVGADSWIAVVSPTGPELCGAHEIPTNKTRTIAEVKMATQNGTPQDSSFILEVFGERL